MPAQTSWSRAMHRFRPMIILAVLAVVAAAYIYNNGLVLPFSAPAATGNMQGSGSLESRSVAIVAEVGGQLDSLAVREGDAVTQGQLLAQIDPILQDAQ